MFTQRVFPPVIVGDQSRTVYDRTYTGLPGTFQDIPATDAIGLEGWIRGPWVGPTSERPTSANINVFILGPGQLFIDTTLGSVIIFDGETWRDILTAEAV